MKIPDWTEDIFKKAIIKFEKQYDIPLEKGKKDKKYSENKNCGQIKYFLNDYFNHDITKPIDFKMYGLFTHNKKDNEIYCVIDLIVNGKVINNSKKIYTKYIKDVEKWSTFRIVNF
ncbi:MAG: hypothetical protein ACOCP8_08730 [archaeon]